jgi:NAD(P)-dependent dehydrogenase (short-subunit alcohol dehydrogenase family)
MRRGLFSKFLFRLPHLGLVLATGCFRFRFFGGGFMVSAMNPTALITGGSRGIGRGVALALAGAGFDVVINYAGNAVAAGATAKDCREAACRGGREIRAEICQADVSSTEDRARLLDFVRSAFGRIDLLLNNAGVAPLQRGDMLEASEASFDRLIAINLKGPYFLTQSAARWMIEQIREHPDWPRPRIITITSISAYAASSNRGDYCVSKAGLGMLTPLFANRLAEHGIQVFEIRPGIVTSDMTAAVKDRYDAMLAGGFTPINRWGTPEDVGKAVTAIAQGAFPFSTGDVFNIDGGFHLRRL